MIHEQLAFAAASVQVPRVGGGRPSAFIAAALSLAGTLAALPADAATPALFLEQSLITGASDTVKAARVPVRNSAGAIKYYDIEVKFELNSSGVPILAAFSPQIGLSPTLTVGTFKAGNYKDYAGNVFSVTGPDRLRPAAGAPSGRS